VVEPAELSFEELRDLHARGLGLCDVLVLAYLRRYGRFASQEVARICGVSERSAFRAMKRLRDRRVLA